mmetsp:Transcript_71428/g.158830  ORF Transcript_71428/g.158830 Transcript_71428/m.158830 type:complete len:277 (+) Transcript_71428:497-1327(+)
MSSAPPSHAHLPTYVQQRHGWKPRWRITRCGASPSRACRMEATSCSTRRMPSRSPCEGSTRSSTPNPQRRSLPPSPQQSPLQSTLVCPSSLPPATGTRAAPTRRDGSHPCSAPLRWWAGVKLEAPLPPPMRHRSTIPPIHRSQHPPTRVSFASDPSPHQASLVTSSTRAAMLSILPITRTHSAPRMATCTRRASSAPLLSIRCQPHRSRQTVWMPMRTWTWTTCRQSSTLVIAGARVSGPMAQARRGARRVYPRHIRRGFHRGDRLTISMIIDDGA